MWQASTKEILATVPKSSEIKDLNTFDSAIRRMLYLIDNDIERKAYWRRLDSLRKGKEALRQKILNA